MGNVDINQHLAGGNNSDHVRPPLACSDEFGRRVAPGRRLPEVSGRSRLIMRMVDITGAIGLLLIFSPVILIAAVLVAATSGGPAIFRQTRVGYGGELFDVLKFRTMVDGTHDEVLTTPELRRLYEENDFKLPGDDPHITKVGRWLRRTSLDELPQLVNILRGEMGLVGVRPMVSQEFARRSTYDQDLYCLHRPALTGLWQVEGRSEYRRRHRDDLDRQCLEQWAVSSNLQLLLRTPRVVLRGLGAH